MSSATGCFDIKAREQDLKIDFTVRPLHDGSIPAAQQDLYGDLQKVLLTIQTLNSTTGWSSEKINSNSRLFNTNLSLTIGGDLSESRAASRLTGYVRALAGCAQVGLQGHANSTPPNLVSTDLARRELEILKSEILMKEGGQFKNRYIRTLGVTCLAWSIPFTFGLWLSAPMPYDPVGTNFFWFSPMAIGALLGLWFSFVQRKKDMTFEDLSGFETDRIRPYHRCTFVLVLGLFLYALMSTNILQFGIGDTEFDLFAGSRWFSFLLGAATGSSERAMGDTVLGALPSKK